METMENLEKRLLEKSEAEWNSSPRETIALLSAIIAEIEQSSLDDSKVAVAGLRLLGKLAGCGPDIQRACVQHIFLVHLVILKLMKHYPSDGTVQKAGSFALMKLALTKENQLLLASPTVRAHDWLGQVLNAYKMDVGILEMALRALWNIGVNPATKDAFMTAKIYSPVLEVMRLHNKDANIQTAGAGVLRAIASDTNNQSLLLSQECKAHDIILSALQTFSKDPGLVETAMAVLSHLCECTSNNASKRKFLLAKPFYVHTFALAAMRNHAANDKITYLSMQTLENLAGFENQDEDLKGMLVADPHRSADAIVMAMREHKQNPAVLAQGFRTLTILWAGIKQEHSLNTLLADPYMIQEVIVLALKYHREHESTITNTIRFCSKLVEDKDARAIMIAHPVNIHQSIANIMVGHPNSKLIPFGFRAIAAITTNADPATRHRIIKTIVSPPLEFHLFAVSKAQNLQYEDIKQNQGVIELLANISDEPEFKAILYQSEFIYAIATWKRESRKNNDQDSYEPAKRLLRNLDYYNTLSKVNRFVFGGYGNA